MKMMLSTSSRPKWASAAVALAAGAVTAAPLAPPGPEPPVPGFSISYMDRSVDPAADFYSFADGHGFGFPVAVLAAMPDEVLFPLRGLDSQTGHSLLAQWQSGSHRIAGLEHGQVENRGGEITSGLEERSNQGERKAAQEHIHGNRIEAVAKRHRVPAS
jgi:hypothetical protein